MKYNKEAREAIRRGANKVVDAVKVTAGAEGRLVQIENNMGFAPVLSKDGHTVVNAVEADDRYENFGARAIKETANLTVIKEGDGTTATSVIAGAIINGGLDILNETDNVSHVELREGMALALEDIKSAIGYYKENVTTYDRKVQIASISANNDAVLGKIIADVYEKVGLESTIEVKDGVVAETTVNYIEGICLERGWAIPHFCNDFAKGIADLDDALVLIYNGEIKSANDIQGQVLEAKTLGAPLLIIADDMQEAVMAALVKLKMEGKLQVCVSISPDFGVNRENILKDLAAATGASVYNPKFHEPIVLGRARKVRAFREKTVIMPLDELEPQVEARVQELKSTLPTADRFEAERINKRISNLKSAVAEILVGGTDELDSRERKDRVDDSVASLRSALKSGYVAGGGTMLYFIANNDMNKRNLKGGQYYGYNIVKEAIKRPFYQILENAGIGTVESSNFFTRMFCPNSIELKSIRGEYGLGINVKTRKIENLLETGIIDSANVIQTAVENAVNVSSTIFSTEVLILSQSL